jgi:hypothetical protein
VLPDSHITINNSIDQMFDALMREKGIRISPEKIERFDLENQRAKLEPGEGKMEV